MEPIVSAGAPVVWVIVQAMHRRVSKRARPLVAICLGVLLAVAYAAFGKLGWGDVIMAGPMMGLAASGLHSGVNATIGAK